MLFTFLLKKYKDILYEPIEELENTMYVYDVLRRMYRYNAHYKEFKNKNKRSENVAMYKSMYIIDLFLAVLDIIEPENHNSYLSKIRSKVE